MCSTSKPVSAAGSKSAWNAKARVSVKLPNAVPPWMTCWTAPPTTGALPAIVASTTFAQ